MWLEQRERGGQREEEEGGDRQVMQGTVGCREDLGFEPEGGGSHGGLWAGEGGADSVLTGAPWWRHGECIVEESHLFISHVLRVPGQVVPSLDSVSLAYDGRPSRHLCPQATQNRRNGRRCLMAQIQASAEPKLPLYWVRILLTRFWEVSG
jgi:hypothetical protein